MALSAFITVIPKEGKDPTLFCNYRPISLLNIDIKLFAKILALRLIPHLQKRINLDQIIHSALLKTDHTFILSTDAEKAFYRVDWTFMSLTLEVIVLGPCTVCNPGFPLDNLYSNPSAQV